ncbi:MAG TPA: substrate-binding domain-containing protein [Planctomycetota bacterium]|nr:substrate-binding domain-containing protein [Planctomycetota bacterium]
MRNMVLACAVVLGAVAGCDSGGNSGKGRGYRFAIVPKMLSNDVFNYGRIAAEKTAREIEAREGCRIEILWQAPEDSDPARQAALVRELADQGVSGISVSVDQENALRRSIDYAVERGIPVMTFDSDAPSSKRRVFFGTDDLECGERLAHFLGNLLGKGKVILQTGTDAPNLAQRVKGAQECFARHFPEIRVIDVLKCDDRQDKAIQQIADAVNTYKDLAGLVLVGGWALFGDKGLDAVDPARVKVVSCDALPKAWQYLESGKCQMLLAQDLWGWGEMSVRLLKDMADGKSVAAGPGGRIAGTLEEVTRENLEAFKKRWLERYGRP